MAPPYARAARAAARATAACSVTLSATTGTVSARSGAGAVHGPTGLGGAFGPADRRSGADPVRTRPPDVAHPTEPLEDPDQPGRRVQLAGQDAVAGAGRVGVVGVVPAL